MVNLDALVGQTSQIRVLRGEEEEPQQGIYGLSALFNCKFPPLASTSGAFKMMLES